MTAEELLAAMAEPLPEDDGYCIIDPETRVITIPPEYQLLGVESDEKAERLYFKCPKIVGDDIDLSKLALRVNFRNAGQVVDQYLVDDVAVDGDNITFSWLLSRRVTQYEGDVNFIVCAVRVSGETITNEWNTTLATAQVLEGLEAEMVLPEEETDIVNQLLSLAETRLNDVKKATADANTAASNANQKAQEAENATEDARSVIEQITKDSYLHTALQSFIDTVTTTPTAYGNAIAKKIEGFIRQETTTGAQLFNINAISTQGSATYKIINDTTVEITGGKSDQNVYSNVNFSMRNVKSLIQGKKIYLYCKFTGDHKPQGQLAITPASGGTIYKAVWSNSWTEVGIPSDCEDIIFGLYPSTETGTTDTVTFSDIKIGLTQFETLEPYTGGQPAPNPDYPMEVQGTGYSGFFDGELMQGVYKVADGSFSGYDERYICNSNKIPCNPGDTVTMKYDGSNTNLYLLFYKKDGTFISNKLIQNGHEVSQVAPAETAYCNFDIYNGGTAIPVDSPGNITILINSKYAVCVKSEGKNLIPYPYESKIGTANEVNYKFDSTGRGILYGTATASGVVRLMQRYLDNDHYDKNMELKAGQKYYAKDVQIFLINNGAESYINAMDSAQYYTAKSGDNVAGIRLLISVGQTYTTDRIFEPMFCEYEEGDDTTFVSPAQSNITYIPVDYPLFEGDKIIQRNGEYKLVRKWGFKTYDGSDDENWNIVYNEENNVYNIYIADMMNDGKRGVLVPNNYFYNNEYGYALHSSYISSSGNYNITISPDMHIDAVQEWKDWLKTHTMYCVYELATPTEETLSPEAQKALHSIMATDEQTELTIVGVPADVGIQNQFLLPRNEDGALNTTAYCTAEKNKIVLDELLAQNLDARVNKLEIDNATLAEQTIIVE